MSNFSINTNVSALTALQQLNRTNSDLLEVQNRVNTGLEVRGAKDNAGLFAIAQNLRADLRGFDAVTLSIDRARSTLDVALAAAETVSDLLIEAQEKIIAASDEGIDETSREALNTDFRTILDQIDTIVQSAEFNGSKLIDVNPDSITAITDPTADPNRILRIDGVDLTTSGVAATAVGTNINIGGTDTTFTLDGTDQTALFDADPRTLDGQSILAALDELGDDNNIISLDSATGEYSFDLSSLSPTSVLGGGTTQSFAVSANDLNAILNFDTTTQDGQDRLAALDELDDTNIIAFDDDTGTFSFDFSRLRPTTVLGGGSQQSFTASASDLSAVLSIDPTTQDGQDQLAALDAVDTDGVIAFNSADGTYRFDFTGLSPQPQLGGGTDTDFTLSSAGDIGVFTSITSGNISTDDNQQILAALDAIDTSNVIEFDPATEEYSLNFADLAPVDIDGSNERFEITFGSITLRTVSAPNDSVAANTLTPASFTTTANGPQNFTAAQSRTTVAERFEFDLGGLTLRTPTRTANQQFALDLNISDFTQTPAGSVTYTADQGRSDAFERYEISFGNGALRINTEVQPEDTVDSNTLNIRDFIFDRSGALTYDAQQGRTSGFDRFEISFGDGALQLSTATRTAGEAPISIYSIDDFDAETTGSLEFVARQGHGIFEDPTIRDIDLRDADFRARAIEVLNNYRQSVENVLISFGAGSNSLEAQRGFVTKIADTVEVGIGNLVDADLARESAKLQALQVQQQLGVQALSIANGQPQIILGLFNG